MYSIVVRRGEFKRYDTLYKMFFAQTPVLWDRRRQDRRQTRVVVEGVDRRRGNRRGGSPPSWDALSFVVIDGPTS